jgi:hypothetical protein
VFYALPKGEGYLGKFSKTYYLSTAFANSAPPPHTHFNQNPLVLGNVQVAHLLHSTTFQMLLAKICCQ